jgi:hypothetical protein
MASSTGVIVGGIEAEIFAEGFSAANSFDSGPERSIIYKLANWRDGVDFCDALLGIFRRSPAPGGPITYPTPHAYPGGNPRVVCHSARLVPPSGDARPDPTQLVAASFGFVHAEYRTHLFNPFPDGMNAFPGPITPWSQDSVRGYTETASVNAEFYEDQDDATYSPTGNIDIYIPHEELIRKRTYVPYLFLDVMANLSGCVNNAIFFGRPIGTVKFGPFDTEPGNAPDGSVYQTVTMTFTWRPIDWNAILRDDKVQWDIMADSLGNFRHPYADLTPLLA